MINRVKKSNKVSNAKLNENFPKSLDIEKSKEQTIGILQSYWHSPILKTIMKNKRLFITLNTLLTTILLSLTVWSQTTANSDDEEFRKYEIGGQFTVLRRKDTDTTRESFRQFFMTTNTPEIAEKITELGLGGRFTYNFTKNIAVEAEANFFPVDKKTVRIDFMPISVIEPGGRKFQAVFGPKMGIRKKSFGVFGKFRPGFIRLDRYEVITEVGSRQNFFVFSSPKENVTFFNVDVGGVFEYYPNRRTVFRVDVGDTIIRYGSQSPKEINPSFTRHNLQTSVGFGFRF